MWNRLIRGWAMAWTCLSVLRGSPKLALLPLIAAIVMAATFGLTLLSLFPGNIAVYGIPGRIAGAIGAPGTERIVLFLLLFLLAYALVALIVFCNVALIACALRALEGGRPSLRAGVAAAFARLPQVLGWALISATLGAMLTALEGVFRRFGVIGEFVGGLLGLGWAAATYFVLPVLVTEGLGPLAAVRRSAEILRRKWGESLAGEGSIAAVAVLLSMASVALATFGFSLGDGAGGHSPLGLLLGAAGIALLVAVAVLSQTLGAIFRAGVYLYATTGRAPQAMDARLVAGAFRPRM